MYNRTEAYHGSEREFWNNYDSLFTESSPYKISILDTTNLTAGNYISLTNKLYEPGISYKQIIADKSEKYQDAEYTVPFPRVLKFKELFVQYRSNLFKVKESLLTTNYSTLTIENNGYPKEKDPYSVKGYWATIGIANLLPRDFELSLQTLK